ncbi:hypothetical protein PHMEG_00020363 [Phytophthora megakarya]|uniref:Uncharacterized protein n=1 Tax=Phytophthora megakarya TaxID=4795 RepID=A0A225VNZ0_9STRA|nr:hypothetical protein PHMEG_00020363 [Phytophthora megakarya]
MAVENVIAANMPPEFGCMFDGWQCLSEHYVAFITMHWRNDEMNYDLLALAPFDEADQLAESHFSFLRIFYRYLTKSRKFLLGDNCATNQSIAIHLGVPLVRCASNRFNLASYLFLSKHEDLVTAVATLMTALWTVNNSAELRQHTQLAPLRANTTRWSSTFTMLERYVRIRDAIKRLDAVYDLIPKPAMRRCIVALFETLKIFNSV